VLPVSLRWRLTTWVAAVMLISAAVTFVVIYEDTGAELRSSIDSPRMRANPRLSVIIPAFCADATLPRVLETLRPQIGPGTEVVVVDSSGLEHAAQLERAQPWVRVIGLPDRVLPGEARNLGADAARGSLLAFLDADALPGPTWLTGLRASLADAEGAAAVAGAVHNGTPNDAVGTTSYLLEFSEWTPGRRGPPPHGATCNLLVERTAFEAAGGFCEDVWPGEDTILTVPWGRAKRLLFAPEAPVWHLNRTALGDLLRHQYRLGRSFPAVCDRVDFPHGRFSRWPLLVFAPGLRFGALARRLSNQPALLREATRVSPLLGLGLAAWTAGVAAVR
jgi:glycosyltransferase involved in cell wall biosynthesis